jgi:hypothetical protein
MSLVRARRVVLLLGALLLGAPRADSGAAIDPLPTLLTDDWDEAQRGAVQERVRALGASACPTLAGYARASDPRAREHAVRAMADAGCSDLADYRGFFSDASAWVVDAVIDAASRLRMAAATPFLLAHVDDRRRLVSDDGALEIAEQADRGLRRLTAQPIPRLPAVRGEKMSGDPAAWRAWYAAHRAETPALWIESGLTQVQKDLAADDAARRLVALETLALLGTPGRTVLAGALRRAPADLDVGLVCIPDEAPRVLDEIPCTLTITNVGTHRLALAIGEPVIRLEPHQATAPTTSATSSASPPPSHGPGKPKTPKPAPAASTAVSPDGADAASKVTDADLALMAGHFLELAPGASVRRSLSVGPVKTAGRYDVHAGLIDLARPLFAGASGEPAGPIESIVSLRFEP